MNYKKNSYKIAKNWNQKENVFYAIDFDLIKIKISWASQNDHQILNFVKATNVVGKKMSRYSSKMPTS